MPENEQTTKCPECGLEIDCLVNHQEVTRIWEYHGAGKYDGGDDAFADDCGTYLCPECGRILASNEGDADRILGKKK